MLNYIIRRLLWVPVLLLGVTVLIFGLLQSLSPIERSALYVTEIPRNQGVLEGVIKRYGLDQPVYVQYWRWLVGHRDPTTGETTGGILRGDFGYSRTSSQPVVDIIKRRFPATLELALWAVVPIISIGVWLGVTGAVNHNKPVDQFARVFSIVGWSFPDFVFGLLLLLIFYADRRWFPPGRLSNWATEAVSEPGFRQITHLMTIDALLNLRPDILIDALRHLVLPVATMSFTWNAMLVRITRSSMLETLRQDYVITARAKGLSSKIVTNRHARRNALIPVITLGGATAAGLLSGVVIAETVFNYPGIGRAAADAAVSLDVVTVLGMVLFNGLILVTANIVIDILYVVIDPRIALN
jgi:peptide/nickel transport system permease protein